jgi:hypothetical protein
LFFIIYGGAQWAIIGTLAMIAFRFIRNRLRERPDLVTPGDSGAQVTA